MRQAVRASKDLECAGVDADRAVPTGLFVGDGQWFPDLPLQRLRGHHGMELHYINRNIA